MNVGVFTDCYRPTRNGVVTSILQLKQGLEQRGHRVVVVTVDAPGCQEKDPSVYRFPSLPFNRAAGVRLGLVRPGAVDRIVQQERLDLLHSHTEFSLGLAARAAARRSGLPLVHTTHTLYEAYRHYLILGRLFPGWGIRRALGWFLAACDALVCPSRKAQAYFGALARGLPSVVIPNGVSRAGLIPHPLGGQEKVETRQALGLRALDRVILYAGRIGQEKRVRELVGALMPLLQEHPHYKLLLVGSGPLFTRLARATRGERQVILVGSVEWAQMARIYAIADLFVTASLSEVHPMTLIEASMCGLPLVARKDEAFQDLVREGYNGHLVDSDPEIARRADEILENEEKRALLSRQAVALSHQFDAAKHVEKMERLYQKVARAI